MFPFFTNAAFLLGLSALAAPVIIHLLLKRKNQRLRFSTVQFFVKQDEQSTKKRKLRNLLLLMMRLLLFALLVFGFARPYLPVNQAAATNQRRQQVIIVLDRSASMQANDTDGARWTKAKELIRQILSPLKPDDRAAVIGCSTRSAVIAEFAPATVVSRSLADLQPTFGTSELREGLQQATKLLSFSDPNFTTTLYVISDLQRSACQNLAASPLPTELDVKVLIVGDRFAPNVALTELQLETQNATRPHAAVANFSDENYSALKLEFKVDGQEVFARPLVLKSSEVTNVDLVMPPLTPGWHNAEVRLQSKDALALDDARYQTMFIPQPVRVLVVESRKTKRTYEEETFFITTALDPSHGLTNPSPSRFTFEKATPEELASKLSARPGQSRIEMVALPGLKQLPAGLSKTLTDFVQSGGGLLLFLSDFISANRYNSELRELLPAQIGAMEGAAEGGFGWRLGEFDKKSSIFALFLQPNSGNLALAEFTRRCTLTTNNSSMVMAQFDDGVPLLLGRTIGQGRVILANTSADTSWTDWPKHKTFVPWLHSVGHFLAARSGADQVHTATNFMAGTVTDFDFGAAATNSQFKLLRLGGKETIWTADDQGRLHDVSLEAPGIYSLRTATGQELQRFTVNVPSPESDLAALAPNEFQQQLARVEKPRETMLTAGLFGQSTTQKELWRLLLLAVLVLLLAELFFANRTRA